MMKNPTYTLEELGQLTGLSPRTIRSYIQKGILPGAKTRGRNATYTEAHLNRLRCMQVIRDKSGLALDDLRMVLQSLSEKQIQQIGTGQEEVVALPIGQSIPHTTLTGDFSCHNDLMDSPAGAMHEATTDYSGGSDNSALEYIRRIRGKSGDPTDSRYAELVSVLERLTAGQRIYRKARNEYWATVKVTEDMEIRVRGLGQGEIGQLERLADLLRHLLMKGG